MANTKTDRFRYIPPVGKRVKLATWTDYSSRDLPMWAWFEITQVMPDTGHVFCKLAETSSAHPRYGETFHIALDAIECPLGWREVYEIRCEPDKVQDVLSWMSRGIVVRQSQYIGDSSVTFQPADNAQQPHWKFGEITDSVPAEQTDARIRVIQREYVYDAFVSQTCRYCKGLAIRPHGPDDAYQGEQQECRYCKQGIGAKYLSEMDKTERKQAIKALNAERWNVAYGKSGRHWFMERETVVKEIV